MKFAIISDSHDNMPNLHKALAWMKQNNIEELIHCGDLCAPAVIREALAPEFSEPIHMVFGNVEDRDNTPRLATEFSHITHYGDLGEIEIAGLKIAFIHYPDKAKELAESGKYDLVFYGHSHKPWEETIGQTQLINPGTLAGLFYKASFAVYDTDTKKLELKILEQL